MSVQGIRFTKDLGIILGDFFMGMPVEINIQVGPTPSLYPEIEDYLLGKSSANTTSEVITPPENTKANDLVMLILASDGSPAIATPEGWILGKWESYNNQTQYIFYKQLTEPLSNFTLTGNIAEAWSWIIFRVPNGGIPLIGEARNSSSTSNFPSSGSALNPYKPEGTKLNFLASISIDREYSITAFPSNMTDLRLQNINSAPGGVNVGLASCLDDSGGAIVPANFSTSGSTSGSVITICLEHKPSEPMPLDFPEISGYSDGVFPISDTATITPHTGTRSGDLMVLLIERKGTTNTVEVEGWEKIDFRVINLTSLTIFTKELTEPLAPFEVSSISYYGVWAMVSIPNSTLYSFGGYNSSFNFGVKPQTFGSGMPFGTKTMWMFVGAWYKDATVLGFSPEYLENNHWISNGLNGDGCGLLISTTTNSEHKMNNSSGAQLSRQSSALGMNLAFKKKYIPVQPPIEGSTVWVDTNTWDDSANWSE